MPDRTKHGPIIIPNCCEVRVNWQNTLGTKKWSNVFHAQNTVVGPIDPNVAETIYSALKAAAGTTSFLATMAADLELSGVHVKDLRQAHQVDLVSTTGPAVGTGTGAAVPLNTALAVTLKTAQSGRQFRGRAYLAGIVNTHLTNEYTWDGASGTAAIGFVNAVKSAIVTAGWSLAIGQRELIAGTDKHGNPLDPRPANAIPVTQVVIVNPRIDSQRRRTGR